MPNDDETFMQERLGFTAMAELFGQPAPCANNARVTINGQYYGLFANEEHVGGGFIKRVFPEAPNGDLFEGRVHAQDQRADAEQGQAEGVLGRARHRRRWRR